MALSNDLLAEVQAKKGELAGPLAGLVNILRLPLEEEERLEFDQARQAFEARFNRLIGVEIAIKALLADGYPVLPDVPAMPESVAHVKHSVDDMEAAILLLHVEHAAALGLRAGQPKPKL
jgi:hypothetical protein